MKVTYKDHMGDDLTVVNAARVSFRKSSSLGVAYRHWEEGLEPEEVLRDRKLIAYLAKHNHWTPFAHPQISLHFKVPFFVANQIKKHQVGFVVNEVSRRYVDSDPEFYVPDVWRARADNVKQGSSDKPVFTEATYVQTDYDSYNGADYTELHDIILGVYRELLNDGVCPEQARMVLPLSTYTEFWMSGSLSAWARLVNQRSKEDTQKETRDVAAQVSAIIEPLFPVSWKELTKND